MKSHEQHYKRKVLIVILILLAIYAVVFSALIVVCDLVFDRIIIEKADSAIEAVRNESSSGVTLNTVQAQEKFPNVNIAYFDKQGKLIRGVGNYLAVYTEFGNLDKVGEIVTATINNEEYRTATYDIVIGGVDSKVKVYYSLEPLNDLRQVVVVTIIIAYIMVMLIILVVSYPISKRFVKPYIELASRSSQLVYDTVHELNTPLAVISTQISNVSSAPNLDEKLEEELAIAKEELSRLKRMVKGMLSLSKLETDTLPIVASDVDINKLVYDITEPYVAVAESQSKMFYINCCDEHFNTDEDKLKQIIHILLDNALKYTVEGESIYVIVQKNADKLRVIIADTGVGVQDKDLALLFDKFYRVNDGRNKAISGNGIGLALLKAITVRMGGSVIASQNSPRGLKIEVCLTKIN